MTGSPPVRRIVTGHDAEGRAVFTADDLLPVTPIPSGDAAFSLIWTTASVPRTIMTIATGAAAMPG